MKPIISVKNISKIYQMGPQQLRAIDDVSLDIMPRDFIAVMGPSGSGKSTLAHILALLDTASEGEYFFNETPIGHFSEDELAILRRKQIGFIFQQFNLLPRMTAFDNIILPAFYSKNKYATDNAHILLDSVGLSDRKLHMTNELSGGQQQRVAISRALVNAPRVLFADEPTGNLDSKSESEIIQLLQFLNNQGITIIMVTHENHIGHLAKRLIKLKDGKIDSDERLRSIGERYNLDQIQASEDQVQIKALKSSFKDEVVSEGSFSSFTTPIFDFFEHLVQSFKILVSHKMRTFLSILGILIGVAAVVSMMAIGKGAQDEIQEQLARLGTNLLILRPGFRVGADGVRQQVGAAGRLLPQDGDFLKRAVPSIKRISPVTRGSAQISYDGLNWPSSAEGVWPEYFEMRGFDLADGRIFTQEENANRALVAIIGKTVRESLFSDNADPIGQIIKINRINFQVIGVLGPIGGGGWRDPNDSVFIPLNTAMRRLFGEDYVDRFEIEISDYSLMDFAEHEIIETLSDQKRVPESLRQDAFRVTNLAEIQFAAEQSNRTMSFLLAAIASISLIVGGIGIMNIMLVSVTERTREVGLRKAIGARRFDILFQFLIESVLVSLTGGILGVLFGLMTVFGLSFFGDWTTSISYISIVLAFTFSVFVGIVFGIYPAMKASKLKPIEALRFE